MRIWHSHNVKDQVRAHAHDRGDDAHHHYADKGKTYFKHELRSDGMPVKCEGHWSVDLGIVDDWAYAGE